MSKKKLLWMDLEMTGLDEKNDRILEVAALVTDYDLHPLDQIHFIVFQPDSVVKGMNAWCQENHKKSGLTDLIATGTPQSEVEDALLAFTLKHFGKKHGKEGAVLAGNSIHNDRRFIDLHLPRFAGELHYRMVDVSSFKEVFREKFNIKYDKKNTHRAIEDILESIAELKLYLSHVKTS